MLALKNHLTQPYLFDRWRNWDVKSLSLNDYDEAKNRNFNFMAPIIIPFLLHPCENENCQATQAKWVSIKNPLKIKDLSIEWSW